MIEKISDIKTLFDENQETVDFLKSSSLLSFTEADLELILPYAESKNYHTEEFVLKQGEINKCIYFLQKGSLRIVIENEIIAHLNKAGSIIGEMSLLGNRNVTANVIANEMTTLLSINIEKLLNPSTKETDRLQLALYKLFSTVLCEKLYTTNSKAKQFEIVNRDLLAAQLALQEYNETLERKVKERTAVILAKTMELEKQNAALLASSQRLESVLNTEQQLLYKFADIKQLVSKPLQRLLSDLSQVNQANSQVLYQSVSTIAHALEDYIRPIDMLYHSQKAFEKKKLLLVESESKQQIIAQLALKGTGVEITVADSQEKGYELIEQNNFDIIFVCTELISVAVKAHEKNPSVHIVLITKEDSNDYMQTLKQYNFIKNIVSRSEEDQTFTIKNIVTTVSKIASGDFFGLEKYLTWGVSVKELTVRDSNERVKLLDALEQYLDNSGIRSRIVQKAVVVSEELLMNAIYDAPTDSMGKSIYNHLPRTDNVILKPEEEGTFRFATDGLLLAVSAVDPFGAFHKDTILKYINSCFAGEAGKLNEQAGKGGAGRGMFQILNLSDLVIFNVKKGVKTEVIALFDLDVKRLRLKRNTSFHYFQA